MRQKLKQYEIEMKDKVEVDELTKDVKKKLQDIKIEEEKMKRRNSGPKEERRLSLKREFLIDAQNILRLGH